MLGRTAAAAAAVALGAALGAGTAQADEAADARVRALEQRLELQAAETAALRRDLATLRSAPAATAPVVVVPSAAPAGSWTTASAPAGSWTTPAPGSGVVSPAAGPARIAALPTGPAAARHATGVGGLRWGGYLTVAYYAPSERNSFFDLHRFVLKMDGTITSCIALEAEVEYEHGGVHDELGGEIVLEYVHVLFGLHDAFTPKVGALLIPFGRYNLNHDDPLNDFTQRPWTARYLVPTGFPQPGVGVEGVFPVGGCGSIFTYDVALTSGFEDAFTDDNGVREARQPWDQDQNEGKQVWGRVAFSAARGFLDAFELGLSGTWATYDVAGENDLFGWGVDWLLRKGPLELKGEYLAYSYERNPNDPPGSIEGQAGLWAEAGWHFMPSFLACRRGCLVTDTSHFTLAFRYQWLDLDDHVTGATFRDDVKTYGFALNYRITERTLFRVDWTHFDAVSADDRQEFTASFSTYF